MAGQPGPDEGFGDIVHALASAEGVSVGSGRRGFGSDALRADGRIFAMAGRGGLVLKLPSERVAELVASGAGEPFDAGKGRPMKEWVVVGPQPGTRWLELAREALAFVTQRPPAARRRR
jgi:TfoX/Sxy family transcriptional regulator of competence genes